LKRALRPGRIALGYAAFGTAWVLLSDLILKRPDMSQPAAVAAGIAKGLAFVAAGAGIVYALILRSVARMERMGNWHFKLFESNPVPMAIYDAQTLQFLAVNEEALKQYGYSRGEALLLNLTAVREPQDIPGLKAAIALMPKGNLRLGVQRHVKRDGTRILVDVVAQSVVFNGRVAILATAEDVTDRQRAEEERERLLSAIEQMAEMMLITDVKGAIQYVNPAFERVTGFTREEVLGRNPRILKSGIQKPAFYEEMWRALTSGKTWRGRMVNKRKDGTRFTEDALISPVFGPGGDIVNYVGIKNDVTAQLALEEQFRQSQKMEAVGRLAGGIAHDFNNMLTVILVRAELARKRLAPDDPLSASLSEIHEAAQRSASLTRQLLTYARRQAVEPRVLSLNETVGGTLQMLRRMMGENIELAWIPGAGLWPVKVDPVQVDQLLANLCVNARDAIVDVGKVTIETANVVLDEEYCRRRPGHVPGDFVRLAVSDSGAGMDKETQAHLFEPFFTTKEVGKGTGLGLATVYGIVKQNEGFIDVYSELGEGTTFKIYLPRHGESHSQPAARAASDLPRAHGETILLVEDEALILGVAEEILKEVGYEVLSAATPENALQIASAHSGPIHLILTDVVMPGMNGRELVERLLQNRPALKSLFMSGYTANVIMQRGIAGDGGNRFIQKPFTPQQLALKLREVLEG
jgi:PAS domain S-box-containing protein